MTPNTAGKYVCKITLYAVIILELLWLFIETRGDFANGILFYLQAQMNIYVWGFFALLFLSSYLLGKTMGAELIKGRNPYIAAIIYGMLESAILLVYALIIVITHGQWMNMLHTIPELVLMMAIPVLLLWLVAAAILKSNMK
ncbi:hypothetical protein [Chitinophaga filiformis]|uniref:Uncharacterized protein n=1 Tax=Chitinophaga filiformis TaxID=104663 RepID=A0ABY4HT49_CHIFI|nr:hypothetical protein [Chitinophaga filiformis]UPK66628.1 hypothetical protein MYF79_16945 [Chitinophaga filiformis]